MSIERGDVFNARFPHASGSRGKKRPVVVVQDNSYNNRLSHFVVAQITTNLVDKDDPACLFIEAATPAAEAAGLERDSVVSGYLLSLMSRDRLQNPIGRLTDECLDRLDECLKAALGLS